MNKKVMYSIATLSIAISVILSYLNLNNWASVFVVLALILFQKD